jgi:PAS domain S-box-containing protein
MSMKPGLRHSLATFFNNESHRMGFATLDREGRLLEFNDQFRRLLETLNRKAPRSGDGYLDWLPDRASCEESHDLLRRTLDGNGGAVTTRLTMPSRQPEIHLFFSPRRSTSGEVTGMTVLCLEVPRADAGPDSGSIATDVTPPASGHHPTPALFPQAVEMLSEGVLILDRHGTIIYANPATEKICQVDRGQVVGQSLPKIMKRLNWFDPEHGLDRSIAAGRAWHGRLRSLNRRTDSTDVEFNLAPLFNGDGRAIQFLGICRDLSAEIRLERQLRQAQKLESLGTLAGGIAHDFNNILGMILGYTELALMETPDGSASKNHLRQVLAASGRARDLIKQILVFSRRQEDEPQPLRIGIVVKDALKLIRSSLPASIQIQEYISSAPYLVMADQTHIHQVLLNLVTNATHAMAERGVLKVELHESMPDAETAGNGHVAAPRWVRLSVCDTGHGIPTHILERMFEPFFTTKKNGEGTGLGLSVVQGIVEGYGGRIQVISSPGEGTTFAVELPLYQLAPATATAVDGECPRGAGHILLVEDEEKLLTMNRLILENLGYEVDARADGRQALQALRRGANDYDLLITDYSMPHFNGIDLIRRLRNIRRDMPVILCTGYSERFSQRRIRALGIRQVLIKPLARTELALAVAETLSPQPLDQTTPLLARPD